MLQPDFDPNRPPFAYFGADTFLDVWPGTASRARPLSLKRLMSPDGTFGRSNSARGTAKLWSRVNERVDSRFQIDAARNQRENAIKTHPLRTLPQALGAGVRSPTHSAMSSRLCCAMLAMLRSHSRIQRLGSGFAPISIVDWLDSEPSQNQISRSICRADVVRAC